MLASTAAKVFDCECITDDTRIFGWESVFIGGETDVDIVTSLFKRVRNEIISNSIEYAVENMGNTRQTKNNYCMGMTVTVNKRLKGLYEKIEEYTGTKELIIVKKDAVKLRVKDEFPEIQVTKLAADSTDKYAYLQGLYDGEKVGLHTGNLDKKGYEHGKITEKTAN